MRANDSRPALSLAAVTKLTDGATELFRVLYDLERAHKADVKTRLAAELAQLDLFAPALHYSDAEDYVPGGVA